MILSGKPLKGRELQSLKNFLKKMNLEYDDGIEFSICLLNENYEIIGTGSVEQNVLKCIAVDPSCQGQGLTATILSQLIQYEFEHDRTHLFMYTKPKNRQMFEELSFYKILETDEVLFMENRRRGIHDFLENLIKESPKEALLPEKKIGAVVANCNPFTNGHRYLLEQAVSECDYVHVFILSDKRSQIPAEDRFELALQGTKDIPNLILHKASDYIISAATFPVYFMKEKNQASKANCCLDVELFSRYIAPELHITKRFVGMEPGCRITNIYNETMKKILPVHGIQVSEIERKAVGDRYISASVVRKLMLEDNFEEISKLVPGTTLNYLKKEGKKSRTI